MSILQRQEIRADLQEQMRIKEEQNLEKRQEEEIFNQMWQADIEAKAKREEADARRQNEANRQTVAYLRQQMAALEEKKHQEKRLIEEEAQLLVGLYEMLILFNILISIKIIGCRIQTVD
jgi:phosphatidate phosphatase PAH1